MLLSNLRLVWKTETCIYFFSWNSNGLLCLSTYYYITFTVPDRPKSVSQTFASSDTVTLSVIPPESGRIDTVRILEKMANVTNQNCTKSEKQFTCQITGLSIGTCFTWSVISVLNGRPSPTSLPANQNICTCKYTIYVVEHRYIQFTV